MRYFLTAFFAALCAGAASAGETAPARAPYAADGTINHHSRAGLTPVEDFRCRKDHSRLSLAAAEPAAEGKTRLAAAIGAGGELIVVDIGDIDCAFCASAIEDAFAARSEVAAAVVNIRERTVLIAVESGAEFKDRAIRKIMKRRGHAPLAIRRGVDPASMIDGAV